MAATLESALLLEDLERSGFALRKDDGKLLITPASKLTSGQREDIRRWRDDLIALLDERAATGKVLAAVKDGPPEEWPQEKKGPPKQAALWVVGEDSGPFRLRA